MSVASLDLPNPITKLAHLFLGPPLGRNDAITYFLVKGMYVGLAILTAYNILLEQWFVAAFSISMYALSLALPRLAETSPETKYDRALLAMLLNSNHDHRIHRYLIDTRDAYMAWRLSRLRRNGREVVAVVGYAHVDGIMERLGEEWRERTDSELDD